MADKTYCVFIACPLTDCERHMENTPKDCRNISFADFASTCKKYLSHCVEEVFEEVTKIG